MGFFHASVPAGKGGQLAREGLVRYVRVTGSCLTRRAPRNESGASSADRGKPFPQDEEREVHGIEGFGVFLLVTTLQLCPRCIWLNQRVEPRCETCRKGLPA
jgi:hypothetical protein